MSSYRIIKTPENFIFGQVLIDNKWHYIFYNKNSNHVFSSSDLFGLTEQEEDHFYTKTYADALHNVMAYVEQEKTKPKDSILWWADM